MGKSCHALCFDKRHFFFTQLRKIPTVTDFLFFFVRFNQENKGNINPYHFVPFGHGPRNCVGMRFALVEAKTTLVKLIHRFRFEKTEETEVRLLTHIWFCY